jgi:uncharacterized protein (DUF1330 family)
MTAFIIASVNVTNPEKYKDYMALSPGAIAAHGGKFVVRGGNPEILEGDWPRPRVVVVEFASREAAKKFYDSVEYTEAKKHREGAAEFSMIVVDCL